MSSARPYGIGQGALGVLSQHSGGLPAGALGHVGRDCRIGETPRRGGGLHHLRAGATAHEWVSTSTTDHSQGCAIHRTWQGTCPRIRCSGCIWQRAVGAVPADPGRRVRLPAQEKRKIGPNGVKIDGAYRYDDDDAFGDLKARSLRQAERQLHVPLRPVRPRPHLLLPSPSTRMDGNPGGAPSRRSPPVQLHQEPCRDQGGTSGPRRLGRMSPAQLEQAEVTLARRWRQGIADLRERGWRPWSRRAPNSLNGTGGVAADEPQRPTRHNHAS
jgi:hypothetical protein